MAGAGFETVQGASGFRSRTRLCENSAWYNRTQNFEACGRAQSKKTQKFILRSALRPNQISFSHGQDPLLPSAIQSSCVAVFLFDQLVRAQQDRCRHIEAKRLVGRHIEHGLVFHRQLHRQIGRLLALKDAVDVGGGAASIAYLVRPI